MNKTIVQIFVLLIIGSVNFADAQINFMQGKNMQEALTEAKVKKRVIFVDVYATWCGPCKWMDEHTFKESRVIEKLNRQFVNLKIDGDTPEGQRVRNLYRIGISYPTYLFINADGKVLHRIEGMMTPEIFTEEADFASKKAKEN